MRSVRWAARDLRENHALKSTATRPAATKYRFAALRLAALKAFFPMRVKRWISGVRAS